MNPRIEKLLFASSLTFAFAAIILFTSPLFLPNNPSNIISPKEPLPLFLDRELTQDTDMLILPGRNYETLETKTVTFDPASLLPQAMARRYMKVHRIETQKGDRWCSENIVCRAGFKQDLLKDASFDPGHEFTPWLCTSMGLCLFFLSLFIKHRKTKYIFISFFFAWISALLAMFLLNGFFYMYNVDNDMWFVMAEELLNGCRLTRQNNTFGNTYVYAVFITALKAKTYNDIAVSLSILYAVVVGGGTMLLAAYASFRLSKSINCAMLTAATATIFPLLVWVVHRGEIFSPDFLGKTMLHLGPVHPCSLTLWYQSLLFSYNGMSDNIGFFIALCSLPIVFEMKGGPIKSLVLGFILGAGLCFRYTTLLLWPAIILIEYNFHKEDYKIDGRTILRILGFLVIASLAFFPQLIDNALVCGNPLRPAIPPEQYMNNTEGIHRLFNIYTISGFKYYFQINFKILSLGIFALFMVANKKTSLALWLWLICVIVFHSMLKIHEISPVRYLLAMYPCLYVVIGNSLSCDKKKAVYAMLIFWLFSSFIVSPENPVSFAPVFQNLGMLHFIIPALAGLAFLIYAKTTQMEKSQAMTALLYMAIFTCGQWWIPMLMLIAFPVWLLLKRRSPSNTSCLEKKY